MGIERDRKGVVTGVFRDARVDAMNQVASKHGVNVRILAEEGERYNLPNAAHSKVPNGCKYIGLTLGAAGTLQSFWRDVEAIEPMIPSTPNTPKK